MSTVTKQTWVNLQEDVIAFVNERNGSAFPRSSKSTQAILAGVFDNQYLDAEGNVMSSKVALLEMLSSSNVETGLELNINKKEWHYVLTLEKGDYVTPTETVTPVAEVMAKLSQMGEVDVEELAEESIISLQEQGEEVIIVDIDGDGVPEKVKVKSTTVKKKKSKKK